MNDKKLSPEIQENNGSPPESVVENNSKEYEFNSYRYTDYSVAHGCYDFNLLNLYSREQIEQICANPMNAMNNEKLRDISNILYYINGIYSNTVDYMVAMPTLDYVIIQYGSNKKKKSKNKELATKVLRRIKHKEVVRNILFKCILDGISFMYFETLSRPLSNKRTLSDYDVQSIVEINDNDVNVSIITLPTDYCKIVGIKNNDYVVAFNLDYFNFPEGGKVENKVRKYPKEIRDAWNEYRKGNCNNWVVLDSNKTITVKIKSKEEQPWGIPLVTSAIGDILYQQDFVDTKRNVLDDINGKLIYELFPAGDKNLSTLTKSQQEYQHNTVKAAIMNKNNRGKPTFVSLAAGTKLDKIDASNTDILDDSYEGKLSENICLSLGIAASLLGAVGSGSYATQTSNLELVSSQLFMWIEQIENEINKCINANIIKDSKNRVEINYLHITNVSKKETIENCKELYLQGKGSLTLWAAACGIRPDVFYALLDEELENDIENKYPVHKTSYTMSNKDTSNGAGRPESDSTNPETIASKSAGKNNIPTPSDK